MPCTLRSAFVYASELAPRGRGTPLWYPEPSESGEVEIGDVGFLQDGGFHRLFNITVDETHPFNKDGVPEGFTPLTDKPRINFRPGDIPKGPLTSRHVSCTSIDLNIEGSDAGSVISGGLKLSCQTSKCQGAILVLKDSATRATLMNTKSYETYMLRNFDSWHALAMEKGYDLNERDIILVTGWTKTSAWHLASFYEESHTRAGAIQAKIVSGVGIELAISASGSDSVILEQRADPSAQDAVSAFTEQERPRNQCIFLAAYKVSRRRWLGRKLKAAAGFHDIDSDDDVEDEDSQTALSADVSSRDALAYSTTPQIDYTGASDIILDYILKYSDAEIAIAGDDELFPTHQWPDDLRLYLEDVRPTIDITEGVGRLASRSIDPPIETKTYDPPLLDFDRLHDATTLTVGKHIPVENVSIQTSGQLEIDEWPMEWMPRGRKNATIINPNSKHTLSRVQKRSPSPILNKSPIPKSLSLQPTTTPATVPLQYESPVSKVPRLSHSPSTEKIKRHPKYYLIGGDIHFLIENWIFRVHRCFFERESPVFRELLCAPPPPGQAAKGSSDSNLLPLPGVSEVDFSRFLWVFYNPEYSTYDANLEEWTSIMKLSTEWRFAEVKQLSTRYIELFEMDPVDKIELYQGYNVDRRLLIPSYTALVNRLEPLSIHESRRLTPETALLIATARERARRKALESGRHSPTAASVSAGRHSAEHMTTIITDVFGLANVSPNSSSLEPISEGTGPRAFTVKNDDDDNDSGFTLLSDGVRKRIQEARDTTLSFCRNELFSAVTEGAAATKPRARVEAEGRSKKSEQFNGTQQELKKKMEADAKAKAKAEAVAK